MQEVEYSFRGHTFSLPGNYIKVVDHAFQDYKFLEFLPSGQENINFQDAKLLQYLCRRFPSLQFNFLDGRLYVECKPRWVHDYSFALQLQLDYFERRHACGGRKWTFLGPSCVFKKSGVMAAMNSDVTIVPTVELMKRLKEVEDRGGEVPQDVEGMICLEVAEVPEDADSVHDKCRKLVRVMGVELAVGIFPDMGIVRTYTQDLQVREQRTLQSLYVDMGEAIPCFRFYLTPLPLGSSKPACFCSRDWIGTMDKMEVVTAVCNLITLGENDCAEEGVFCSLECVNTQDKQGRTPMVLAAAAGNREMLEFLAAEGGEVDYRDQRGMTPLLAATGTSGSQEWLECKGFSLTPSADDIRLVIQDGADKHSRLKTVFGMADKGVLEKCMVKFVRELWLEGVQVLHEIGSVDLPRRCITHVIACDEEAIPLLDYAVSRGVRVTTADVRCAADGKLRDFLASKLVDAETLSTL